ncbi:hypothetical protein LTR50_004732 [Elasticomyces elasticus]|nr:hypothetical protein LTR50_004732 [Elasticomyces elasticus]
MLLTCDPDLVKRMNAVRSNFTRGDWYTALRLHPTRDNITSIKDEALHSDLRNHMAPGYSGKENMHMEQDIDGKLLQMFDLIREKYISTETEYNPLDLSKVCSYFTLDVISGVAFGKSFGFLDVDDDPLGYIKNLEQFLPAIMLFSVWPELQRLMRLPLVRALAPSAKDAVGLGRAMCFAEERVRERFGKEKIVRRDMLGAFINRGMSQEQLESETLTQITAGSDSTASSLRCTLLYISTNPAILSNILSEFHTAASEGRITRPIIRDTEARQLPYLQACIKEGLRMYPPVTGLLAKEVPKEGAEIDGKFVPGGTQIGWNSWGMQRNRDVFGGDVEVFRPERWLPVPGCDGVAEKGRLDRMNEVVGMVFGYGRFGCLGRGVATMELNKAFVEILSRFSLQPVSIAQPMTERCFGFYLHSNMLFRVTERHEDSDGHLRGMNGALKGLEAQALPGAYEV